MTYTFAYRPLAEALYDSLVEDAFYIAMEASVSGGPSVQREAMLRYYDYSMQEAHQYGHLVTPESTSWGASIWSIPMENPRSRRKENEKKAFLENHMGEASLAMYSKIVEFMDCHTRPCVTSESWYLSIVGVAPAFQGKGYGQSLIRPLLEQADRSHTPVYIETFTPRNMPFYCRLGFQENPAFDEPTTGARYWVMVREPAA